MLRFHVKSVSLHTSCTAVLVSKSLKRNLTSQTCTAPGTTNHKKETWSLTPANEPKGADSMSRELQVCPSGSLCRYPGSLIKRNKNQLCEYMTAESAHLARIPAWQAGNFPCNHTRRSSAASKISDRTVGNNAHAHCSQSLCKPRGSQFRSQRLSSFRLAPRITDHWKNPNKLIKSNLLANPKTVRTLIWFWQVICVHTSSMSHETTLHWHFVKKFPFSYFRKPFFMPFIHICYWTFQICIQLYSFWARRNVRRHD